MTKADVRACLVSRPPQLLACVSCLHTDYLADFARMGHPNQSQERLGIVRSAQRFSASERGQGEWASALSAGDSARGRQISVLDAGRGSATLPTRHPSPPSHNPSRYRSARPPGRHRPTGARPNRRPRPRQPSNRWSQPMTRRTGRLRTRSSRPSSRPDGTHTGTSRVRLRRRNSQRCWPNLRRQRRRFRVPNLFRPAPLPTDRLHTGHRPMAQGRRRTGRRPTSLRRTFRAQPAHRRCAAGRRPSSPR